MRSTSNRWISTRPARRHKRGHLDNIALVPVSELASLALWQERARSLPAGETLLVLPMNNPLLQAVGEKICLSLKDRGRRGTVARIPSRSRQSTHEH